MAGGWDATQKYLTVVPTALALAASVASGYAPRFLAVNIPVWVVVVSGKFPSMYRVRLFGINSTPGIDDGEDDKTK